MRKSVAIDFVAEIAMSVIGAIGLFLSCLIACFVGVLILIRAPFLLVTWLIGKAMDGCAVICAWLEDWL